jgi:hypothetical protein
MDENQLFKQIIEFNQTSFNNAFSVMTLLQDQFEKISSAVMDQAADVPASTRKAVENWAQAFKDNRDSIKKQVDENFEHAVGLFGGS